jgi:hypothetical protein
MIALDTETTGVDFAHGTRPFFVSTCDEHGRQTYYEWDVDPLTRKVQVPAEDVRALRTELARITSWHRTLKDPSGHRIVGHNVKFDVTALWSIGVDNWPWEMTEDTITAGHVLNSDDLHNLTDMSRKYLHVDIQEHEDALEVAVKDARKMVQQARLANERYDRQGVRSRRNPMGDWRIADDEQSDMPSAGGTKAWKADYWMPRAAAKYMWEQSRDPKWLPRVPYRNETTENLASQILAGRPLHGVLADALQDAGFDGEHAADTIRDLQFPTKTRTE